MIRAAVAVLALLVTIAVAEAGTSRDPQTVRDFRKTHPCPHTGLTTGPCAGYVVDHKYPLCAGGADAVENMQWQDVETAKTKDRLEVELCRCLGK